MDTHAPDLASPRSALARGAISLVLVVLLTGVVAWSLPDSPIRRTLLAPLRPLILAVGLDQDWTVFSPNPGDLSFEVEGIVTFTDGTSELFRPFKGDPIVGEFRGYRWRKWSRRIRRDASKRHWEPTARYLADRYSKEDRTVSSVVLRRRWSRSPEPGTSEPRVWNEYDFYRLELILPTEAGPR